MLPDSYPTRLQHFTYVPLLWTPSYLFHFQLSIIIPPAPPPPSDISPRYLLFHVTWPLRMQTSESQRLSLLTTLRQ